MRILLILLVIISFNALANECSDKIDGWNKLKAHPSIQPNPYLEKIILNSANRIIIDSRWTKLSNLEQLNPKLYRSSLNKEKTSLIIYVNEVGEVLAYIKTINKKKDTWCSNI
ncbi:MAG: hypothetical protein A2577_12805 [Bdellovibrionales bacterium RIFOXYD1_FULL_36_51]|nr:MAG: hypothetical protein A2577_12805 [Bdellovibrionales bacterium RIFOXYD1_FULL_36_51]